MSYRGTVKNGMVVLEEGATLPEGTVVSIDPVARPATKDEAPRPGVSDEDNPMLRILDLAVDIGIPDLSVNIDHYLYGHPKVDEDDAGR